MTATPHDRHLIRQWRRGNDEAFALFYGRYKQPVFFYLLALVGQRETAEDLLQDTFVRFIAVAGKLRVRESLGPYLVTLARHVAIDWFRRQKLERQPPPPDRREGLFQREGNSQDNLNGNGLGPEEAGDLLYKLPEEQREAVVMKIYLGFSFEEVARVMNVSPNTAASRYRYGLQKLQDYLNKETP